jgi:Ca2+-binding RTX toxin-like protein
MPDLNYLAYLTSGSHYQLELLQAEANYAITASAPGYGDSTWTLPATTPNSSVGSSDQQRAIAWNLREIAAAAYITPDSDPLKAYFVSELQSNMHSLVQQYITNGADAAYGQLAGFIQGYDVNWVAPWQQGYIVTSLAEIAGMNIPQASADAVAMLNYMNNFIAGMFTNGSNGFAPLDGAAYWLSTNDPTTGAPYTTWAQFYQANLANGNIVPETTTLGGFPTDLDGGYPTIAKAALADLITYTQSPQAIQAYGYVVSQITYAFNLGGASVAVGYQTDAQWSQMPRLPDGVWLPNSQMQIDTSGASSVTLTARGGDSLLAVVGNGTATLTGGSGGCDLLYGGSGPTTLIAGTGNDYMFGGSGPTTFVANIGNDYMRGGTGPNTYQFAANHSGHDTIANFNSATDHLQIGANLNGIATASQLVAGAIVAGATVSNGNTVLHLSPNNDITLLGVSSPVSLLNSILVS